MQFVNSTIFFLFFFVLYCKISSNGGFVPAFLSILYKGNYKFSYHFSIWIIYKLLDVYTAIQIQGGFMKNFLKILSLSIPGIIILSLLPGCIATSVPEPTPKPTAPPILTSPFFKDAPGVRSRVIVSSDIGGTDYDDFQSMIHLFLYADTFDLEGIIASPWGQGRTENILGVIKYYEIDYPKLKKHSDLYPTPEYLRSITKQGAIDSANYEGFGQSTEGSDWIIQCAKRDDPRPLWVLTWGGLDDLAQALHDDPLIKEKLRVYSICGPNKKWSATAYNYIETHHRDLWIIENNSTYRGWSVGGNQDGYYANSTFVMSYVKGRGALGDYLVSFGAIKMGDTPSVVYVLGEKPEDPTRENWGGQFVRAWARSKSIFERDTTADDIIETFSLIEFIVNPSDSPPIGTSAHLVIESDEFPGWPDKNGKWHFMFMPKSSKSWSYTIKSNWPSLDGRSGAFTSVSPSPGQAQQPSPDHPNWWTDNPDPDWSTYEHQGAKTVSQYREDFLHDFAYRLQLCAD